MEVSKSIKLNSGHEMPTIGLGTYTMFKVHFMSYLHLYTINTI